MPWLVRFIFLSWRATKTGTWKLNNFSKFTIILEFLCLVQLIQYRCTNLSCIEMQTPSFIVVSTTTIIPIAKTLIYLSNLVEWDKLWLLFCINSPLGSDPSPSGAFRPHRDRRRTGPLRISFPQTNQFQILVLILSDHPTPTVVVVVSLFDAGVTFNKSLKQTVCNSTSTCKFLTHPASRGGLLSATEADRSQVQLCWLDVDANKDVNW